MSERNDGFYEEGTRAWTPEEDAAVKAAAMKVPSLALALYCGKTSAEIITALADRVACLEAKLSEYLKRYSRPEAPMLVHVIKTAKEEDAQKPEKEQTVSPVLVRDGFYDNPVTQRREFYVGGILHSWMDETWCPFIPSGTPAGSSWLLPWGEYQKEGE